MVYQYDTGSAARAKINEAVALLCNSALASILSGNIGSGTLETINATDLAGMVRAKLNAAITVAKAQPVTPEQWTAAITAGNAIIDARYLEELKALFLPDDTAALFDYSGIANLYEDSAATIPAAVGSPVGVLLDVSQGLELGAELWTAPITITNPENVVDLGGGAFRVYRNVTAGSIEVSAGAVVGKTYKVTFTVAAVSGQTLRADFRIANTIVRTVTSAGTYAVTITAPLSGSFKFNSGTADTAFEISNISIRELKGNHAIQATTANKPTLRQTPQTGCYFLEAIDADRNLTITFATAPGSVYVGRMTVNGTVAWTNPTLGTTWNIIQQGFNAALIMRGREFAPAEQALFEAYAARQAPNAGEVVI